MTSLAVGIAGLGAIGTPVARALAGGMPGLHLEAVVVRDPATLRDRLPGIAVDAVEFDELAERCEIVIEALPRASFRAVATPVIERGRIFMPLTVGALLDETDLIDLATARGARIIVPTGALLGLDAVRAAAEGTITSVSIETRKPPVSLRGAPYFVSYPTDIEALDAPKLVFDGNARDGARGFPASVNVAAALSLAGIGPERTRLQIWADPSLSRNVHTIRVESDSAHFTMQIENIPSENPRTGKITPLSVIATLRGLVSTLKVGT